MKKSIDLLNKALDCYTARVVAEQCGVSEQAMSNAKKRGTLSPEVAGHIAVMLGEDPVLWMAIAGLEAARESKQKAALMRRIAAVFVVGVAGAMTLTTPYSASAGQITDAGQLCIMLTIALALLSGATDWVEIVGGRTTRRHVVLRTGLRGA